MRLRQRNDYAGPGWGVVALIIGIGLVLMTAAAFSARASGQSCCTDRAILANGVRAAHRTLRTAPLIQQGGDYHPNGESAKAAMKQLEDAARAAGVSLDQAKK